MLQDLSFGALDNAYRNEIANENDIAVCVYNNKILFIEDNENLRLPKIKDIKEKIFSYLFTSQNEKYFLVFENEEIKGKDFVHYSVQEFQERISKDLRFSLMTAWHLYVWYRDNKFCGRCGEKTVHDKKERMMRCEKCGNMIFPKICPAVIVGVTHGNKLLLARGLKSTVRYGLIAGFMEIGETAEECVKREVMEEVGLKVKNIRYYKSQPWGIAGNISLGFYCDLDNDDETVTLQEEELSLATWFDRNEIPYEDNGISLTGEMIRMFKENKI